MQLSVTYTGLLDLILIVGTHVHKSAPLNLSLRTLVPLQHLTPSVCPGRLELLWDTSSETNEVHPLSLSQDTQPSNATGSQGSGTAG